LAFVAALVAALIAAVAIGAEPPRFQGAVTDVAGKLSPTDRAALTRRIEAIRSTTGNEIAVLILPTLGGESIEDVAYTTFNAWKLGQRGADNGVLLVVATGERSIRIETGKGTEGALTDLQAGEIINGQIGPFLKRDRLREGLEAGVVAIDQALRTGEVSSAPPQDRGQTKQPNLPALLIGGGLVLFYIFGAIKGWWSPWLIFYLLLSGGRGGGGGGGGGGGWSGGGGGGSSGGGGASGRY
jgi:uncharacterized protein